MTQSIFAVVVAYIPELEKLSQLCKVLAENASVIVVDNTPGGKALLPKSVCTWITNNENLGIASAQNIGIREALKQGAQAIAMFDQDSYLSGEVFTALLEALSILKSGVVVPVCKDATTEEECPSVKLSKLGWPLPVYIGESQELTAVDLVISSGSLASSDVFNKAGLMDDKLFIDYVDFEWCARVRAADFPIVVTPRAVMRHSIGQLRITTSGQYVRVHNPIRFYYRLRNAFYLVRYPHIRYLYAFHEVLAGLVNYALLWRHSDNPRQHFKMGFLGLKDGLAGRLGRLDQKSIN